MATANTPERKESQKRRVPKLAYRNSHSPSDHPYASPPTTPFTQEEFDEITPVTPPPTARLTSTSSSVHPTSGPVSPKPALGTESASTNTKPTKKKKSHGMLRFLDFTTKEPSKAAFEQYAKEQLKKDAEKKGAVGLANISMQKLPEHVPKVNSKWDGLPAAVKAKEEAAKNQGKKSTSSNGTSRRISQGSANSRNTHPSGRSSRSEHSSNSFNDMKEWSERDWSKPAPPTADLRKLNLGQDSSMSSLPEMTYFFPDDPLTPDTSPVNGSVSKNQTNNKSSAANASTRTTPKLETVDESTIVVLKAFTTDMEPSIPPMQTSKLNGERGVRTPETNGNSPTDSRCEEAWETQNTTPKARPLTRPRSTTNNSSRPTTPNFSRPLSSQFRTSPDRSPSGPPPSCGLPPSPISPGFARLTYGLPTLRESSPLPPSSSTSSITTSSLDPSSSIRSIKDSDVSSIAGSVTPSEMSASWYQSSRDRLGLGGRIRKTDALPWDNNIVHDEHSQHGKQKKKKMSVFGRS